MKKMFKILVVAILALTLAACSSNEPEAPTQDSAVFTSIAYESVATAAPAAEPFAKVRFDGASAMVYESVQNGLYNMDGEIVIATYGLDQQELVRAIRAAYNAPDVFWVESGEVAINSAEETATVRFIYTMDQKERDVIAAELDRMATQLIAISDGTPENLAFVIGKWLNSNVSYDAGNTARSAAQVTSALKEQCAVCTGYSKTFAYVMAKAGFSVAYITGDAEGLGPHAWNAYEGTTSVLYADTTIVGAAADQTIMGYTHMMESHVSADANVVWYDAVTVAGEAI